MTTATITTTKGAIKLELFTDKAPETTGNFIKLAKEGPAEAPTASRADLGAPPRLWPEAQRVPSCFSEADPASAPTTRPPGHTYAFLR